MTECCICLDDFDDNVTVCGHAVCKLCLDKVLKCPMCRKVLKNKDDKYIFELVRSGPAYVAEKMIMVISGIMAVSVIAVFCVIYF
jgi:hypothetical protein